MPVIEIDESAPDGFNFWYSVFEGVQESYSEEADFDAIVISENSEGLRYTFSGSYTGDASGVTGGIWTGIVISDDASDASLARLTGLEIDGPAAFNAIDALFELQPAAFEDLVDDLAYTVRGSSGADVLTGFRNADYFYGGSGSDTLSYAEETGALKVVVSFAKGTARDTYGSVDRFEGIENIIGSDYDDLIIADGQDNTLYGGEDDDKLNGKRGDDTLYGGLDDDLLIGGNGADLLFGGDGDDKLNGGADNDILHGDLDESTNEIGDDLILGQNGDDILYGGYGIDVLHGGAGNDTLDGGYDDDRLIGAIGNDTLYGGWNDDFLHGGVGDDILSGGGGNDILIGAAGADMFLFEQHWSYEWDEIRDYDPIEDSIRFSGFSAQSASAVETVQGVELTVGLTTVSIRGHSAGSLDLDNIESWVDFV
ncbi:MAG: hypothetical protein MRY63_04945 [Neomegalonema sp.]|nr:hypothetical protein [Neomegalonema sp.]